MSRQESLDIGLTEVLYGVVIANAIYELTFSLELRNAMLVLALGLIVGDWIEYQFTVDQVSWSAWLYVKTLIIDVLILVIWYFLTILPVERLDWFFAVGAGFFLLQYSWDVLVLGEQKSKFYANAQIHLTVIYAVLGAIATSGLIPPVWLVMAGIVMFFGRKTPVWKLHLQEAQA